MENLLSIKNMTPITGYHAIAGLKSLRHVFIFRLVLTEFVWERLTLGQVPLPELRLLLTIMFPLMHHTHLSSGDGIADPSQVTVPRGY
jgi:hypothetical protein